MSSISFDIFARDRASATLDNVGKSAERTGAGFDKMKGFAVAAGALAGAAIVKFGSDSISAASDLNETISKSNVIFGSNAAAIEKWAGGGAKSLGLSKAAALDVASGFGNMFTQIGFAGDKAADMSKKVVQMSADLGSFNNLPTADVADMMAGAFRGEYDSLQRLIPNINAARVQQVALEMSHKTSAAALTASEKAAAVLAIVQKDGARATGDFARTADGLANSQKIQRAELENASAALGTKLLPAVIAVTHAGTSMIEWGVKNTGTLQVLGGAIALGTVAFGAYRAAVAIATFQTTLATEGTVAHALAAKAAAAGNAIVTAAQWAWNAALTANPIGLVVVAIGLLVAGLVVAYRHSETFRDVVQGAFRAVATAGDWLWDNLRPAFAFIVGAWLAVAGAIVNGAADAFGWMPGIGGKLRAAADHFNSFRDQVNSALNGTQKSVQIQASTPGSDAAYSALRNIEAAANAIPREVRIRAVTIASRVPGVPGFAGGVQNFRGGLAMVGEQGPELVTLPAGSSVHSASDTSAMMTGGPRSVTSSPEIHVHFPNYVGNKQDLIATVRDGLADLSRNGGRLGF